MYTMACFIRWCMIYFRRYLTISIIIIICFTSALSVMFYKWAELDVKLDCLTRHYGESTTTTTLANPYNSKLAMKTQMNTGELISQHYINKSELRLRYLHQKVEKMSRKVKKSQSIKLMKQDVAWTAAPNPNVHAFYYAWYGNVEVDGHWRHWDHEYLPNWKKEDKKVYPTGSHEPPSDISSNFYPALGCYSSHDPKTIDTHMRQLSEARVGVVVVSWYPPGLSDAHGDPPDPVMPVLLDAAHRHSLRVAPHIEPYRDRNPINLLQHLRYLWTQYGHHPALYRMQRGGRDLPVLYVYDSYLTPAVAWKELLSVKGNLSIRGTRLDSIFLGLLVDMQHRYDIKKAHFDGFYTYFATNGFTYGSSWKNWRSLGKFARQNGLVFVPCVGPGYIDTQLRPWNVANTRHRRHGKYYEVGWRSAIAAGAKLVAVTSFNEWHEGTQIEPAKPRAISTFTYLDYETEGPNFYLNLTRWWVNEFSLERPPVK